MKKIPVLNGHGEEESAIVDNEDYPLLSRYKWRRATRGKMKTPYVISHTGIHLAHMILGTSPKVRVQYKDKDFLNNQKSNIREAKQFLISRNSKGHRDARLRYKGVTFCKDTGRWRGQLQLRGKKYNVGRFDTEVEAAEAYDEKVKEVCGEGIYFLNFP